MCIGQRAFSSHKRSKKGKNHACVTKNIVNVTLCISRSESFKLNNKVLLIFALVKTSVNERNICRMFCHKINIIT